MIKKFNEHIEDVTPKFFKKEEDIILFCNKNEITDFTINDDMSLDVNADVYLSRRELTCIPVKFNYVDGCFRCSNNLITSLEGSPEVVTKDFYCYSNKCTTLSGSPRIVGGDFNCSSNNLISLEGSPEDIGRHCMISRNKLSNLKGGPREISGGLDISSNQIYELNDFPEEFLGKDLNFYGNPIAEILDHFELRYKIPLCKIWGRFKPVYQKNGKWFVSRVDLENMFFDVSERKINFSKIKFRSYSVESSVDRLFDL